MHSTATAARRRAEAAAKSATGNANQGSLPGVGNYDPARPVAPPALAVVPVASAGRAGPIPVLTTSHAYWTWRALPAGRGAGAAMLGAAAPDLPALRSARRWRCAAPGHGA